MLKLIFELNRSPSRGQAKVDFLFLVTLKRILNFFRSSLLLEQYETEDRTSPWRVFSRFGFLEHFLEIEKVKIIPKSFRICEIRLPV